MRLSYFLISILCLCLWISCGNGTDNSSESSQIGKDEQSLDLKFNAQGLPLPDLGITVVNPTGWTEDQMSFQQNYCLTMFDKLDGEYDPDKFCECFLAKVQYYYKPVYIFEAFEDQKTWNSYCLKEAGL